MIGWCFMNNSDMFYVDVNGKKVIAEILVTFSFYNNYYCAYSIKNDDTNLNDIYSAKIINNTLINITDKEEKQAIDNFISNLFHTVKGL